MASQLEKLTTRIGHAANMCVHRSAPTRGHGERGGGLYYPLRGHTPCLFVLVLLNTGEDSLMKSAEMNCAPICPMRKKKNKNKFFQYAGRKFHPSQNSILLRAQAKCWRPSLRPLQPPSLPHLSPVTPLI